MLLVCPWVPGYMKISVKWKANIILLQGPTEPDNCDFSVNSCSNDSKALRALHIQCIIPKSSHVRIFIQNGELNDIVFIFYCIFLTFVVVLCYLFMLLVLYCTFHLLHNITNSTQQSKRNCLLIIASKGENKILW